MPARDQRVGLRVTSFWRDIADLVIFVGRDFKILLVLSPRVDTLTFDSKQIILQAAKWMIFNWIFFFYLSLTIYSCTMNEVYSRKK